ncbi:hypothetical protein NUW58_g4250 [Xylaria curta]|uniref:Uncharacterized protein n=1 Tax=Xylaria curta TaxID=42375 RepID=A0ACC1P7B5_9PEZI|nr:hypothetical protein NUW58_g4250 [Xylaria curta]
MSSGVSENGQERDPYRRCELAIQNNSAAGLKDSLAYAKLLLGNEEYTSFLGEVLCDVLSHHSIPLILHMLDYEGVPLTDVLPSSIYNWATEALINALSSRGWDINTRDRGIRPGYRLIDYLVKERNGKEDLARWLIDEKRAAINAEQNESSERDPPPILEICAAFGTLAMFQFLEARGAYFSPRILHEAVEMAADIGADPSEDNSPQTSDSASRHRFTRVELLIYLINERGLDVNAVDEHVPPEKYLLTPCATLVSYAARCPKGAPIVRWLLSKGADPTLKGDYNRDAIEHARESKCDEVLVVMEEWVRRKNETDASLR